MKTTNLTHLLALAVTLFSGESRGNLINGSFESPAVTANTRQSGTPDGWSWSGTTGWIINGSVSINGYSWPTAGADGQQYLEIGNSPSWIVSQTFTISTNGGYVLSWFDNTPAPPSTSLYSVAVLNAADQPMGMANLDASHNGEWKQHQLHLILGPGQYTVRFQAQGNGNSHDTLIDNIALDPEALSGTLVSGTIVNQVWKPAGSPYRVTGDLQIAGLTIQPGVTVLFYGDYSFEVAGRVQAIGTPSAPIVFMGTNSGWEGIHFNRSGPGSVLAYCVISNSINSGIRIEESYPIIANCVLANNRGPIGGGLFLNVTNKTFVLQNCRVNDNTSASNGGGIAALLGASNVLQVLGCAVSQNVANAEHLSGTGTAFSGGGIYIAGSSVLRDCVIRSNWCFAVSGPASGSGIASGAGLYSERGSLDLGNCLIAANESQADVGSFGGPSLAAGGGISISSGSLTVSNCMITGNQVTGSMVYGGGVEIVAAVQPADLVNCSIAYNNAEGIYSEAQSTLLINSILYFNATQLAGVSNVTYSDVQGGAVGRGNIDANPIFFSTSDPVIVDGSPCVDVGSTNAAYHDLYFPPSLGGIRNDMGAHGGPGAGTRLSVQVWPSVQTIVVRLTGGIPGIDYSIEGSTDLANWSSLEHVQIAHVGDVNEYVEPGTNSLTYRFYRLKFGP